MTRRLTRRRSAATLLTVAVSLGLGGEAVFGSGRAVEGTDRVRLLAPAGAEIESYSNDGYALRIEGREIVVEVQVAALGSDAPFVLPQESRPRRHSPESEIERLARALTRGATTEYDAVTQVLSWVSRNLRYELDRELSQEPSVVLERGSGYCTGLARTSVALLSAVGILAREVPGYVFADSAQGVEGYHRWIEVYYPDRGWVFSDPIASHNFVPATYVRLASGSLDLSRGMDGLLLSRRNQLQIADVYPPGPENILGRKNEARQLAGAVAVEVSNGGSGRARLSKATIEPARDSPTFPSTRHLLLEGGEGTFLDVAPGEYLLEVELDSGELYRHRVVLRGPVRGVVSLHAASRSPVAKAPVAGTVSAAESLLP